jgi:hypothetical protein
VGRRRDHGVTITEQYGVIVDGFSFDYPFPESAI